MKRFTKHLALLVTFLLTSVSASAYSFKEGGIYYDITNSTSHTVSVTYLYYSSTSNSAAYTGEVIIPATVTNNGVEYSVTSIGPSAFYQCSGLTSVTIPNSVTSIGSNAFQSCSGLTSVTIPNSVTSIGSNAFQYCSGLTSVTIPNSVTSIGSQAFYQCSGLTSVTIPNSVTSIGSQAFHYCSGLTCVTIPNSVTSIGDYAFSGCSGLTSVTIPNSVTSIGSSAFSGCSGLTSVTIPNSVTSIGDYAFSGCSGLTSVTIPNSVTSIGSTAFYKCSGLTSVTIPNSVTSIGSQAFQYCSGLTSVTIPNSVTSIGSYAFRDCSRIKDVYVILADENDFAKYVQRTDISNIFHNNDCSGKTHHIMIGGEEQNDIAIPSSVTSIGSLAFYQCSGLTSVTIPNSVTSIGTNAFQSCSGLTSVTIPNSVTSIGSSAFSGCTRLTSVTIPNSVTSIGSAAFAYCSGLTSVTIPNSVTSIGSNAFQYCSGLTSVTIGNSVESIGSYAFYGCNKLRGTINLPTTLTSIGAGAFASTTTAEVNLMSSNAALENKNAFLETAYVYVPDAALEEYRTGNVWSEMATRIFPQNSSNVVVTTTARATDSGLLEAIGGDEMTQKIVSLKVIGTLNSYDFIIIRNKMINLHHLDLSEATIEASNYEYYTGYHTNDNEIGDYMFYDLDRLVSVVLPSNITKIGNYAFRKCNVLQYVTNMPESCTSIGTNAFADCPLLTAMELGHGLQTMGTYAFYCSGLREITLNGSADISNYAFQNCKELRNLEIPGSIKAIGVYAFNGCSNLKNITFHNGLLSIGSSAFSGCDNLQSLHLPTTLTTIGSSAFFGCTAMEVMHTPSMLKSIGDQAFKNCGLKEVYAYDLDPIQINQNTFDYWTDKLVTKLYRPAPTAWEYYINTQWSQFIESDTFTPKYSEWFTDGDITIDTDKAPIESEDENNPSNGEINPGGGIIYVGEGDQVHGDIHLHWGDGKPFPSFIFHKNVKINRIFIHMAVKSEKWYFFCFPYDVSVNEINKKGKYVWRYYDGKERAEHASGGWKNLNIADENTKLNANTGYIFRTDKADSLVICINMPDLTEVDKKVDLETYESENKQDASWNLVGNPNLSYYDVNDIASSYPYPITVWDEKNQTYVAISPSDDNYQLHPFEAFFVQKPTSGLGMEYTAENRITATGAEKKNKVRRKEIAERGIDESRLLVNITLSNDVTTDRTRVVFNDEHSMDYELECDASKFMSTEVPQIFTTDNSKQVRYAINERPNGDGTVKLGYSVQKAGTYTIGADRMDCNMLLQDLATGEIHDLSRGFYDFKTEAGTFEDRFLLIKGTADAINTIASEMGIAAVDGGINLGDLKGRTARIYTLGGAQVATASKGTVKLPAATYIVTVGNVSTKLLVK